MFENTLQFRNDHWVGTFQAMACPCEIIIDTHDQTLAQRLTLIAQQEAVRIQDKFSRYQTDNIVWQINHAEGQVINVDVETAKLIDFSNLCFQLSDGLFDVTSGCLRRAWKFDGSDNLPLPETVTALLPLIGWQKIHWQNPQLQLPANMEIDFGGVGKEYAVDSVLQLLRTQTTEPCLVNFGGDLAVTGPQQNGTPWQVGVEIPDQIHHANTILEISAGALATSGDSRRYLLRNGIRYSHILNPFTGYPVSNAPRAITVAGSSCVQAGMLATFGLLQGGNAEVFLQEQKAIYWCSR